MGGFHDQHGNYRPDLAADARQAEIDRLRAELAEARRALLAGNDTVLANKKLQEDNAAKDARIAETERCRDNAEAALEAANARIAELDRDIAAKAHNLTYLHARAERAEAAAACYARQVGSADAENANLRDAVKRAEEQAHYANGVADLAMKHRDSAEAERDALREALELVDADVRHHLRSDAIDHALLRKHAVAAVRAALAPSPAGREG